MKTIPSQLATFAALLGLLATRAPAQDTPPAPPPPVPPVAEQPVAPPVVPPPKATPEKKVAKDKVKKPVKKKEPLTLKKAQEEVEAARKLMAKVREMKESEEKAKQLKAANKRLDAATKQWEKLVAQSASKKSGACCALLWLGPGLLVVLAVAGWFFAPQIGQRLGLTASTKSKEEQEAYVRGAMARSVMGYAFLFVTLIVILVLGGGMVESFRGGEDPKRRTEFFEMAKYVLGVMLPVVAAWVGTVMAFYFGKENFQAASKSLQDMAEQVTSQKKLQSTKVDKLGMPIGRATKYEMDPGKTPAQVPLDEIRAAFKIGVRTYERLPVLHKDGKPICILHLSTLNEYEYDLATNPPTGGVKPTHRTLQALFDKYPWLVTKSFGALPGTSTGTEAQALMGEFCKDVFVTENGTPQGKVQNWITNLDLLSAAQV